MEAIDLSDWQWEDRGGHGLISFSLSQQCDWRRHPLRIDLNMGESKRQEEIENMIKVLSHMGSF